MLFVTKNFEKFQIPLDCKPAWQFKISKAGKTIVCGHWHILYDYSKFEGKGTEFGKDADFSPYIAPGIVAFDTCTAYSDIVNCIIVEDG